MVSTFRNVLGFLERVGIYDVVIPFLLVYAIVFAILERTRVFGEEQFTKDGPKVSKKNLNSLVAFCISFFTIASNEVVKVITDTTANVVILIMLIVFFLTLYGVLKQQGEPVFLSPGWQGFFSIFILVMIVIIFLHSLGWLDQVFQWLRDFNNNEVVATVVLLIVVVGFMFWITKADEAPKPAAKVADK